MSRQIFSCVLVLLLSLFSTNGFSAEPCISDGEVQFICGPKNPEDLYQIPDTSWVIASGSISNVDGSIYAVNIRDYGFQEIFPEQASKPEQDFTTFSDCPGPNTSSFQPHGIALREGIDGIHTLYVVGHGDREAIEVFNLDVRGSVPSLQWIGCVVAPAGVTRFNAVTSLPNGAIAATDFDPPGGESWEWHPASGWTEVPGSQMRAPNGIVSSEDGKWLYIGGWIDQVLVRLSRGQTPLQIDSISVGFRADNLRWAPDGSLLLAGQVIGCEEPRQCRMVGTRAVKVDPITLNVQQLVDYPDSDLFRMGTVAIQVNDEVWVGGLLDGQGIARFPK